MNEQNMRKIIDGVNVLIIDKLKSEIFCIKRALSDNFFPGMYALPGGGINKGESREEAAKREFLEETGYEVHSLTGVKIEAAVDVGNITLHVLVLEGILGEKKSSTFDTDIAEVGWVSIDIFIQSLEEHHYPESEIQKFRNYLRSIK